MVGWGQVRELIPGDYLAVFRLGKLQAAQGQRAAAEVSLRQAIAIYPNLSEAWYDLGELHVLEGKLDKQDHLAEARAQFEETLRLDPENKSAMACLAQLHTGVKTP